MAGFLLRWRLVGPISALIKRFKYHANTLLLRLLPLAATALLDAKLEGWVLVPIPSDKRRTAERGIDHTALLARGLSEVLGIAVAFDVLRRGRPTASLTGASRKVRLQRIRGAFVAHHPPAKVLLIDDVTTTGATLREAARTLQAAGTEQIAVFTLARTPDIRDP